MSWLGPRLASQGFSASHTCPALQAAIPTTPWHSTKSWSTDRVPTMIIGAIHSYRAQPNAALTVAQVTP
jgi:hypothetical protein